MATEITRQELYEQVWEQPMVHVGSEYGLSGNAIKKYCTKYRIPVPGRGHWAKLKAGKKVRQVSLPPRGLGMSDNIRIGGHYYWRYRPSAEQILNSPVPPEPAFTEPIEAVEARVRELVGRVPQPKSLNKPHRFIGKLLRKDEDRRAKYLASSLRWASDAPFFDSSYEKRRLRIASGLYTALSKSGMKPSDSDKHARNLGVMVGDQRVSINLDSPDLIGTMQDHYGPLREPKGTDLRLQICSGKEFPEIQTAWEDKPESRIEQHIQEIVVAIIVTGEIQHRQQAVADREWWIETKAELIEEQKREEEEARKREAARLRKLEQARIDHLLALSRSYEQANKIRKLVLDLRPVVEKNVAEIAPEDFDEWASWALAQADRIDPVASGELAQSIISKGPSLGEIPADEI